MSLYQLSLALLPVPLGLAFAFLLGVCALRPGRCVRPKWARDLYRGLIREL